MCSISVKGNLDNITTCSDDEEYIVVGGIEEVEQDDNLDQGLFMTGAVVLQGMDLDAGFGPAFKESNEFGRQVPIYDKGWAFEFTKCVQKDTEFSKKLQTDNQQILEKKAARQMQALEQHFKECNDEEFEGVDVGQNSEQIMQTSHNEYKLNQCIKPKIKFKNVIAPGSLPPVETVEMKRVENSGLDSEKNGGNSSQK
eukprot:TRINITY_DN12420_c0_g1_i3.p3 TRINITY_DN12420_c0_g1~~TRINITY_DN12420_c0_g1_i3.p3  ORF type:complete len:198 (+),score=37.31 TRINITY_DN12420_c0_g1_i3:98-691(+)